MSMLDEDIFSVIRSQKLALQRNGIEPDAVYLGHDDWNDLRADSRSIHFGTLSQPGQPPEILGLRIFVVDTKLHVRVVGERAR